MTWFYQPHGSAEECSLFPSHIDKEVVLRKAVVLVTGETNSDRDTNDVSLVEVLPSMTATLPSLLEELFGPGLASGQHAPKPHYCSAEIRLGESIVDIKPVLQRPNPNLLAILKDGKNLLLPQLGFDSGSSPVSQVVQLLTAWRQGLEHVISSAEPGDYLRRDSAGIFPSKDDGAIARELHCQCQYSAQLGEAVKELDADEVRAVEVAASVLSPAALRRWKDVDARLRAARLRCQERVSVLTALQPALHVLESLPFMALSDNLPAICSKIRGATVASPVYSSMAELACLLGCVASQLAQRSKEYASAGGKAWDEQPKAALIAKLDAVISLRQKFEAHCRDILSGLSTADSNSADKVDLYATQVTNLLATVASRHAKVRQLILFSERFAVLGQHTNVPGLSVIAGKFAELYLGLKVTGPGRKGTKNDLLNPDVCPDLDTHMLEFAVHVNDLEVEVQDALRRSFDQVASTEHALSLLRQYTPLLAPDTAQREVQYMYEVAFRRFSSDIEDVQALYEKHKRGPPLARGAPPAAGAALWARGLLRRIERPMKL